VSLVTAELLKWSNWSADSKLFLTRHPETVRLSLIAREYLNAMQTLWTWTFEQYEVLHTKDVDEINALVKEINLTMTGGALDRTNMEAYWKHLGENNMRFREGKPQLDWADIPENTASI
jgi:hypothetical protein